jgi:sec-independent protein translocase protein TatA
MFDGVGPWQVVIVAVIALILFGSSRIPEMMRGLGSGIRQFKKALHEEESEEKEQKKQA